MQLFSNLSLLFVGVAVAGMGLLGFVIFLNNIRSTTNRAFFYFAIVSVFWSIANYSYYQFPAGDLALMLLRGMMFFATWHALTFFHLASVFPDDNYQQPWWYTYLVIPIVGAISVLALTPYVFEHIATVGINNQIISVQVGQGIKFFGALALMLIFSSILMLIYKTVHAPKVHRLPYSILLVGMIITFVLLLTFNLFFPIILNNSDFIQFGAVFLLPFIVMTSYAVYRHRLFDLQVVTTGFLGFIVTVFSFVNIIYSTSISAIAINIAAFTIVLIGSIKIMKDTLNLKRLTEELTKTNQRQETLIHFIGHEVKGFLTKAEGAFSILIDGDLGVLPDGLKSFVERSLAETRGGVSSVSDILKASNLKKGTVEFKKEPFDLKALVVQAVDRVRTTAETKGLTLALNITEGDYQMVGDKGEIGDHVLRNLIDNAINYTPTGSVIVSLKRSEKGSITFSVQDTGVGISNEDKVYLFTEGGHGKESMKVNVHSTGYGLFIAKTVTVAHGGTISTESEGPGKGSTFIVEFPA